MAFKKETKIKSNFTKITIGLASPEEILENSFGEVTEPETINYRTYKPERDGLFCERIFGPTKDYECACGKYKRIRYKGIVCDRCGVEVTEKKVRRERTGHIELVVPVAHIWYFRSLPNKIGYLLGLPTKKLDAVIYYEKYIVIQPGLMAGKKDAEGNEVEGSHKMDLLSEDQYLDIIDHLPPLQQRLFRMKEIEGYTADEIMRITGCSAANLRKNLSRARIAIRTQFIHITRQGGNSI